MRTWNSHHNAHGAYTNRERNQNKTQMGRLPSVNTKLQPITSKSPTKSVANPLKLTLIQTHGHSPVANNYPDAFNTHFYRWPIASQSPSSEYDIKWRAANNPFASQFNPTIETVPISTAVPTITTTAATTTASSTMPTARVYRTFTEHRLHTKHHMGIGYVKTVVFICFCFVIFLLHFFLLLLLLLFKYLQYRFRNRYRNIWTFAPYI